MSEKKRVHSVVFLNLNVRTVEGFQNIYYSLFSFPQDLQLEYVHGYRGFDSRDNLHYVNDGADIVFHAAGAGIVKNLSTGMYDLSLSGTESLRFFHSNTASRMILGVTFIEVISVITILFPYSYAHYTPGIYAEVYIVFIFPSVCMRVRDSVPFVD